MIKKKTKQNETSKRSNFAMQNILHSRALIRKIVLLNHFILFFKQRRYVAIKKHFCCMRQTVYTIRVPTLKAFVTYIRGLWRNILLKRCGSEAVRAILPARRRTKLSPARRKTLHGSSALTNSSNTYPVNKKEKRIIIPRLVTFFCSSHVICLL